MSGWELWLCGLYAFVFVCLFGGLAGYAALLFLFYKDVLDTAQPNPLSAGPDRWD